MGILEWLSGRNGIYKNDTAINNLYAELDDIKNNTIDNARNDCREAVRNLNLVHGMEYVANIGEESFDAIYDEIDSAVEIIRKQVEGKVADIDAFSNATGWEKIGSTLVMTGVKFGEGALSVFESIGDGLVSVAGFVGGGLGAKGFQEGCAKIIQKSWSHDLFNFYYNSDFAKASLYTEDSGAASIVKIAGQTGAYLLLGGFASGAAGKLASSGSKLVQGAGKFLASTTRTNTAIAAVGGLGQGTETGLNAGLDYNTAFGKGAKQALVQGGTAYIFGRLGEKAQKSAATKSAQNDLEAAQKEASSAEAAVSKAKQGVTEAETALGKAEKGVADAQKTLEGATKARPGIETKLTKAQNRLGKLETAAENNPRKFRTPGKQKQIADARNQVTSLQRDLNGIDTRIGEASKNLTAAQEGRTAAQKAVSVAKDGVYDARATLAEAKIDVTDANEAVKLAQNSKYQGYTDSLTKTGQKAGASVGAKGVKATIKDGIKNLGQPLDRNPLVQNQGTLAKVKDAGVAIYNNTGTVGRTAISGVGKVVSAPVQVTKEVVKGMAGAVAQQPNVARKAAVVAVEAVGVATGTGYNYANAQARTAANNLNVVKPTIQSLGGTPSTVDITPSAKNTGIITGQSGNSGNTGNTGNNGNTGGPGNNGNNYNNWNTTPPAQNPTPPTTTPTQPTNPVTPTTPIDPVIPTTPPEPTTPTVPTTPTEPTTPENPGTTITNPEPTPTPPVRSDNGGSNSGVDHGGNYDNGTGNIWSGITGNGEITEPELPDGELPIEEPTDTELPGTEESVYTIPTDLSGVTTKKKSSSGSSVIPILGGLGAAAAVGVGAKIYMDNKKNNDNGEDDDYTDDFEFKDENNDNGDDLLADEWKEDDNDDTSLNFNDIVNDASEDNNDLGEI